MAAAVDRPSAAGYDTGRFSQASAPVAQLDRVSASEAEGRRFESCRAHQIQGLTVLP